MSRPEVQGACRNPQKPFKEILQGDFKQVTHYLLKDGCKRIYVIQGDIWVAQSCTTSIQVIDVEGKPKQEISGPFRAWSVKEAPWGDIVVASETGLHVLHSDGTVLYTICGDIFFDVAFFGEEIIGLNGPKGILQTYSRSGYGDWRHSGDIRASQDIGMSGNDCVVTSDSEIVFTMHGTSSAHYYKCLGKTGSRTECSPNPRVKIGPMVCGVDCTGAVLVADRGKKQFQVHETDGQWSVFKLDSLRGHDLFDLLYDPATYTIWVLSYKHGHYLTKLREL